MQLLLVTARRTAASRWICHSRRRGIQHATTSQPAKGQENGSSSRSTANQALRMIGPARTRFAPSPTGNLHLGSLRTALFNYLVAKATGGEFLLRIEDTDKSRTVPGAEARLYEDLEWAGIQWDEGPKIGGPFGPYKQSQRIALYQEHAEQLVRSGNAYRCFCSPGRLHTLAQHRSTLGLPPDYDRACVHIPKEESEDRAANGEAHVVRLKAPPKYPAFKDLVYGLVRRREKVQEGSFDDPILLKSDGFPTYHLANVVDDHLMEITHVIRGAEWMPSTPKHLALYQAFGWQPPAFAHVGLLLDQDHHKLSKRNGAADLEEWRSKGIFPEAIVNFVALLGWSHNERNDVMSMEELIRNASMKYTKGDTIVSFEKLWYLQRNHAGRYASLSPEASKPSQILTELALKPIVKLLDQRAAGEEMFLYKSIAEGWRREDYVYSILWADAQNYTLPNEFINRNIYFFSAPSITKLEAAIPPLKLRQVPPVVTSYQVPPRMLISLMDNVSEIEPAKWNSTEIKSWINWVIDQGAHMSLVEVEEVDEAMKQSVRKAWRKTVYQYLRWATTAGKPGPDCAETMRVLGKEETFTRLKVGRDIMLRLEENEAAKDVLNM